MRNDLLDDEKGYPWRASLTKVARYFYCGSYNGECAKGHELKYPLIAAEHHCPDYRYRPDRIPIPTNIFATPDFPECTECSKYFQGACSGKSWIPVHIKNGKCEFFRDAGLICKNAVPFLQYGDHIRNNYCKLPPRLRNGDTKGSWKCCCPNAHNEYVEGKKCYRPLVSVQVPDSRPELETDRIAAQTVLNNLTTTMQTLKEMRRAINSVRPYPEGEEQEREKALSTIDRLLTRMGV